MLNCLPKWLKHFAFPLAYNESSYCFTSSPAFDAVSALDFGHSNRCVVISSVHFSHSVVSELLRPHGLQHTRLPCPSPTPRACQNSCPSSWWCYLIISSSVIPFSFCLQSFPASGSFPVIMYGCVSWTIKKAECWRIDAFELWCWRRLLRVPWTARRSNQSILKEISPDYSLEGPMLKLKLRYFGPLMQRTDS